MSRWSFILPLSTFLACNATPDPTPDAATIDPPRTSAPSSTIATTSAPATPRGPVPRTEPAGARQRCNDGMIAMLGSLDGTVKATFYVDPRFEDWTQRLSAMKRDLVPALGGRLELEISDDTKKAAALELHQTPKGYLGAVVAHGADEVVVSLLGPDDHWGLPYFLATELRRLLARAGKLDQRIGVVSKVGITPEGTTAHTATLASLPKILVEVEPRGDSPIDPSVDGLILLQSDEDWSDEELRRIDAFMMLGGKTLLVVAGAVNMQAGDASMRATLSTRRLERLIGAYGVDMKKAFIFDEGARVGVRAADSSGAEFTIASPGIIAVRRDAAADANTQTLDDAFAGFFRRDELTFPFPSPLVPHPERQPKASVRVVARSTANSSLETTDGLSLAPSKKTLPASGDRQQHAMAVSVSGELRAAFGDASAPGSRVLVIAAPQLMLNPYLRAAPPEGGNLKVMSTVFAQQQLLRNNILAWEGLMQWMLSSDDLSACSAVL